ncbi:MAG: hypothetical protein ACLFRV_11950 [Acidimicrobiales bacterium]
MLFALQAIRPLLLLGIILASGPMMRSAVLGDGPSSVLQRGGPPSGLEWASLVSLMLVFAAVTIVGRERETLPAILALEGVLAATLTFVPPFQWAVWFGVSTFTDATGGTLGLFGLMQPLAATWLVVVAATAIKTSRSGS